MKIREIMTNRLVTVQPTESVSRAARLMRDADIGDVLVTDNGGHQMGILTDRDIAVRVVAQEKDLSQAQVGDFMSRDLYTASPDTDVEDAADMMAQRQVRRLPIVEGDRFVGIVSLGDLAVDMEKMGIEAQSPAGEALEDISKPAEPRLERVMM